MGAAQATVSVMATEEPEDETKRRFREALERKNANSAGGSDHKDGGRKKQKSHGPVEGGRREFRRKSG